MALFDFEFQFLIIQHDLDELVESKLMPKFSELRQKIYHPSQDDVPGRTKFDNFEKALNSSQKVILLVTNGFLEDNMSNYYIEKVIANKDLENILVGVDALVTEVPITLQCLIKHCYRAYKFDRSDINDQIHDRILDQVIQNQFSEPQTDLPRDTPINNQTDIFKDRPPPFPNFYDVSIISSDKDFDIDLSSRLDKLKIFSWVRDAIPGKSVTQNILNALLHSTCSILILNIATIEALSATRLNLIMEIGSNLPFSSFIVVDPYDKLELNELPLDLGNSVKILKSDRINFIQNEILETF